MVGWENIYALPYYGNNVSSFCSIICVFVIVEKAAEKPKSRGQTSSRGKRGGRRSGSGKGKKSGNVSTHVDLEDENSQDLSDSNANKLWYTKPMLNQQQFGIQKFQTESLFN